MLKKMGYLCGKRLMGICRMASPLRSRDPRRIRDEKEQAPRSVYNKFENVMSFLKAQGIRGLAGKNDWPRYTEEEPGIYEQEELNKLFAKCEGRSGDLSCPQVPVP
jgi:integrase/recombinase XerD